MQSSPLLTSDSQSVGLCSAQLYVPIRHGKPGQQRCKRRGRRRQGKRDRESGREGGTHQTVRALRSV